MCNLLYPIQGGVSLRDCPGNLGGDLRSIGLGCQCVTACLGYVAAGLGHFCAGLRGFSAGGCSFSVGLCNQHLSMGRIGLLTSTHDRPAAEASEQESYDEATD